MEHSKGAALSMGPSSIAAEASSANAAMLRRETLDPSNDRKIKAVWKQHNLLSLDGGGIRGIWSLLALETLMKCIQQEERKSLEDVNPKDHSSFHPKDFPLHVSLGPFLDKDNEKESDRRTWKASRKYLPCHYFDIICGSSTGALIAIMLGRLRMPVADCLHEYQTLAGNVFGKPNFFNEASWFWVPYLRQSKYDTATLEKTFKDVASKHEEQSEATNDEPMMRSERRGICGTCVVTSQRNREKPGSIDVDVRISSYERHNRWNPRWPIWKVARAATAAPFYFDPVRSEKQDIEYTDGGLGESNNPINIGIDEIKEIAGKNGIGIAVSVGTARGETRTRSRIKRKLKEIIGRASDPEKVHKSAEETIPHYYRINRPDQLRLELDDWRPRGPLIPSAKSGSRTLEEIKNSFYSWYGSSDGVQEMFQKCAEELVERRKARAEDKAKWEHFATGMQFKCPGKDCNTRPADIDRDEFVMHINHEHQDDDFDQKEDQATIIKNSSSSWQYQEFQSGRS